MRFGPFACTDCLDWDTKKDNLIISLLADHQIHLGEDSSWQSNLALVLQGLTPSEAIHSGVDEH